MSKHGTPRAVSEAVGVGGKATACLAVGLLAVMAAFMVSFVVGVGPAQASTTFTVNSTDDLSDPNFVGNTPVGIPDGRCDVDTGAEGDQCTLRAAIQEANFNDNDPIADLINFAIPGDGPHTTTLSSSLPPITEAVTIDGYSEAGSSANTLTTASQGTNARIMVVLDGGAVGWVFEINASNVVIKGMAIHSATSFGIFAGSRATNLRIEGNFIGTNSGGVGDKGNGTGIQIESAANFTIGGGTPAARNLISGSDSAGISVQGSNITGAQVEGNLIGTTKDGSSPLPNGSSGISFDSVGEGNSVGGSTAGSANTIAYNGDSGVFIFGDNSEVSVLRNSIYSNTGDGINLAGVDPSFSLSDPNDTDTAGPNEGQNHPFITSAKTSRTATVIKGTFNSEPGQFYTLRFFSNPSGGRDEGKTFKAERTFQTDAVLNPPSDSFTFKLKGSKKIRPGQFVTATATSSDGDTSEFSLPVKAKRP